MIASRYKAFGLALMAVLGLMVVGVAGAQAATQGVFLLDGKAPVNGTLTASLESSKHALMSTVGKNETPIEVECTTLTLTEAVLNEKDGKGSAEFTHCSVITPAGCEVAEPIVAKALALVLLHKPAGGVEESYIILEPQVAGEPFTTLHFKKCVLIEEAPITGLAVFKDCELKILEDKETHLLTEVPHGLGLAADEGLKFGAKNAELLGSSNWSDPGHTWAAH